MTAAGSDEARPPLHKTPAPPPDRQHYNVRHCWVDQTHVGILLDWRRHTAGHWEAYVVWAPCNPEPGKQVQTGWIAAARLGPG